MVALYTLSNPRFNPLAGSHNIAERNVIIHITASAGGNIQNWINFVHSRDNGRAPYSVVGDFLQKQIRQLCSDIDRPVAGLRNNLGTWPDTNRHGAIQVCINASDAQIRTWVNGPRRTEFARWIAVDLLGPIARHYGAINFRNYLGNFYGHEVTTGRGSEARRATVAKWTNFKNGLGAHQLVPRQDPTNHWDPCMPQDFIDQVVSIIEDGEEEDVRPEPEAKLARIQHAVVTAGTPGTPAKINFLIDRPDEQSWKLVQGTPASANSTFVCSLQYDASGGIFDLILPPGTQFPDGKISIHNYVTDGWGSPADTFDQRCVSVVFTADGKGYWIVSDKGGVFTFGNAKPFGVDIFGQATVGAWRSANNTLVVSFADGTERTGL